MERGAFQLSLGFIIAVVFAVALLSLAIIWVRDVFEGLFGLSDDLRQKALQELEETFKSTAKTFDIYPHQHELPPGKKLIMSAGVKNVVGDGESHPFVVNLYPVSVSSNVCEQRDVGSCGLTESLNKWLTFSTVSKTVQPGGSTTFDITILPDIAAKDGHYLFHVIACGLGQGHSREVLLSQG